MNTLYFKHSDPGVSAILRAAWPDEQSHRDVGVTATTKVYFGSRYWDEGQKHEYRIVKLDGSGVMPVPDCGPFNRPDGLDGEHVLPPGFAVVERHWSGVRQYWRIYVHPDSMPKSLPAPAELTWAEQVCLCATRSLKSSYGGISNYRFHEARSETGITTAEWDSAKASLIARGLLNKAGAITAEGKNAIGLGYLRDLKRPAALV